VLAALVFNQPMSDVHVLASSASPLWGKAVSAYCVLLVESFGGALVALSRKNMISRFSLEERIPTI
jgi:dethiobiotin synthetase